MINLPQIIRRGLKGAAASLSREGTILLLLLAAGAFLRLYSLGGKSLWVDEAFSLAMSQRDRVDFFERLVGGDTHPPLYYLALKYWTLLGDGEAHLRLLSALFSIVAIPLMYALVSDLFRDKSLGLVGAAILAFSPFQIWYAQEARMYTMLTFLALLSAYFFFRALRTDDRRDWLAYALAAALALYTDNGAIWFLLAISIFYLLSLKRFPAPLKRWLLGNLLVGLVYLPWLPFFLRQARRVTESFWLPAPTFETVLGTLLDFHSFNFPLTNLSLAYMALIFACVTLLPAGGWTRRLGVIWLFVPLLASLLLSLRQPIFLSRNLILASLGYYLLTAEAASRLASYTQKRSISLSGAVEAPFDRVSLRSGSSRSAVEEASAVSGGPTEPIRPLRGKTALLILLLPLVTSNLVSIAHNLWREPKEDWRSVASYVALSARDRPGGIVVFLPRYTELPFAYYFKGYDLFIDTQGYPGDEILLHPQPVEVHDIAQVLDGRPYVWLVVRDIENADPDWAVKSWLEAHGYQPEPPLRLGSLSVHTYVRSDLAPWSRAIN
ncbi:MAG TPA: glycosyltransferase family 39 protein [Anaerolineales bacterium]|nr:glycosyltransferase family 39 protein [Anaerolineales bacterium]